MKAEHDRTARPQIDSFDDLIVKELCDYQIRLDQGQIGRDRSVDEREIPVEFQPELEECRDILDLFHEARIGKGFPLPESETCQSLGSYALPPRIGRFKILEQLGFGGFGVVFRGIDPITGRQVAIKIPRPELLGTQELLDRFAREASMMAQLDHPNIVSVTESSCEGIVPFLVMSYVPGKTLSQWRSEQSEIPPRTVAEIARDLALAVAHAHDRGVLHRDLKPGNILLCPRTAAASVDELQFIPILTDFGMARCADFKDPLTRTGAIIGTMGYLSPEQVEGRSREITARTDVYGLGAVLYELLTGRAPFGNVNDHETIHRILHDEPIRPLSFQRSIPIELEVICLKCLEKAPSNRYQSAQSLMDDLQRYLNNEPIYARPVSSLVHFRKWISRHPTLASIILASVVSLGLIAEIAYSYNARLAASLETSERERSAAQIFELDINRRAYDSDMRNAKISLDRGNLRQMLKLLNRHVPKGRRRDLRDFAWWYMWREIDEASQLLGRHGSEATAAAVTRRGDLIASGGADSMIRIWSMTDKKLRAELVGHEFGTAASVNFSPSGEQLVSAGRDGTVRVWDLKTQTELFVCRDHQSHVFEAVYSPNGDLIASAGADNAIRLWNPTNGAPSGVLRGHTQTVVCLAFHPTESTLASGSRDGTIRFWNLKELCSDDRIKGGTIEFSDGELWPRALVFEPDGKNLIAGIRRSETRRISFEKGNYGNEVGRLGDQGNAFCLVWPSDGTLVSALGNSEIRMADRFDWRLPGERLSGHFAPVLSIAAPADGSFLVSASEDGCVRYWPQVQNRSRINVVQDRESLWDSNPSTFSVQWGNQFVAADFQREQVAIYRLSDRRLERTFRKGNGDDFVLSASGRLLLIRESGGLATCYRVSDGDILWTKHLSANPMHSNFGSMAIDDSETFACVTGDKEVLIVSMPTSSILHRFQHPNILSQVQFLKDKQRSPAVISSCHDGIVRLWDVKSGDLIRKHSTDTGVIQSFSVSNNGRLIAIVNGENTPELRIYRLEDMADIASVPIPKQVGTKKSDANEVAFLNDSKILVRTKSGLSVWDIQDEAELLAFPELENSGSFAISPDGQQIAIPRRGSIQLIDGRPQSHAKKPSDIFAGNR